MKVPGTIAGTPFSARLAALCWGALTLLVPVAVSACTSGTSTAPPASFAPTLTTGGPSGPGPSPGNTSGGTSGAPTPAPTETSGGTSGGPTPAPTATSSGTPSGPTPAAQIPVSAADTGGGGTAGFQDTLLLTLGAMAILAGAGGLIYRRWLGRGR